MTPGQTGPEDSRVDTSGRGPAPHPDPDAEPAQTSSSAGSFLSVENPRNFIERITVIGFFYRLYRGYSRRNGPLLSAGIAYYALFSLGPLLLLTLQITGRLFGTGPPTAEERITEALAQYLGEDMAAMFGSVAGFLAASSSAANYSFALVSLGILLYGATRLFVRLQASFNIMWDIRIVSRQFSASRLVSRLLVFGMILIPTLLLVVSLVLGSAIDWLRELLDRADILIGVAQAVIPFLIAWLALIVFFVVLPDIKLRIRDCWFTSLLVAIAWAVGTRVFGIYLSWTGSQQYAGAVGALIGVIFWVDVLAIITLLGVRFNRALYLWRKKKIEYYFYAAPVLEDPDGEVVACASPTEEPPVLTPVAEDPALSESTRSADETASEADTPRQDQAAVSPGTG